MNKGLVFGLIAGAAATAAAAAAVLYVKKKNEYCCCDDFDDELSCDECCDCCDCEDDCEIPAEKAEETVVAADACACSEEELLDNVTESVESDEV